MEISRLFYNKFKSPFIRLCLKTKVSANQITILNHFMTLTVGCYAFSRGEYIWGLIGVSVCFINGMMDYADGEIARIKNQYSKLGIWLDSGFDIIIQNAVMGAIAVGCYKNGLPMIWIVMFFIANCACNFVSFNYNSHFGFDSDKGNEVFRTLMNRKCHIANMALRDMIDPTTNTFSLILYTYRYWIVAGFLFGIMNYLFMAITVISTVKWIVMFLVYSFYLSGEDRLYIFKVLSALDEEKEDYYALRGR